MSSSDKYVTSPIDADYQGANQDVIDRGHLFAKRNHRLLSGLGKNANISDGSSNSFKYVEMELFSTKDINIIDTDPSMLDKNFVSTMKDKNGCVYNVLKFNRDYNIRTFDFIITYTQLADYSAKVYKAQPITKQFKGSFLFTGCSSIRDTTTMEALPLKLYAKYESIGDTVGDNIDLDAKVDTKGGPAITFKYTYDSEYVYLYISSISPFRLIPVGDGEYVDISYVLDEGTMIGEDKKDILVEKDPITGERKSIQFSRNNKVYCSVSISLKDTSISHSTSDVFEDKYEAKLDTQAYNLKATSFTMSPTNDGEQIVVGMSPASDVNLEIAPDLKPIRFGSRLLKQDKSKVDSLIEQLKRKIEAVSTNTEKVAFTIKTSIRTRGKYNVSKDYFSDDSADGFGQIIINDVGVYNSVTDTYEITEYITDRSRLEDTDVNRISRYLKYKENASDYLKKVTGNEYSHVRQVSKPLDIIESIEFENPNNLDVYYDIAFIRASTNFEVVKSFAEFGNEDEINDDDKIIYICKDGSIKICGFKDYNMKDIASYDVFDYIPDSIKAISEVTHVDRAWTGDHYLYVLGTNTGIVILVEGLMEGEVRVNVSDAFIQSDENKFSCSEAVSYISTDNTFIYVGGVNGNIRIIGVDSLSYDILPTHFRYGDKIVYAEAVDNETIVFISKTEIASYNLASRKWSYEGDEYRIDAMFDNPYYGLEHPNIDYIVDEDGFEDVPLIQIGQYVYALGYKSNSSGYSPVYKRMDILDGSVIDLTLPDHQFCTYKSKVCRENNLIYVIGGTPVYRPEPSSPTELKTLISVFDISTNKWISHKEINIVVGDDNTEKFKRLDTFCPTVLDGKIYIFKPYTSNYTQNKTTLVYSLSTSTSLSNGIVIDTTGDELVQETIDIASLGELATTNNNLVPVKIKDGVITLLMGARDVVYKSENDSYEFNGYTLYRIGYDVAAKTFEINTQKKVTCTAFSEIYSGANANNSKVDLFNNFTLTVHDDEVLIYCLDRVILYVRLDIPYAEMHMTYHNNEKDKFAPMLTQGEYIAWNNNGKTPNNTFMVYFKNYVVFIGGTSGRATGYLSLDAISMIPAPRYSERNVGETSTSILNEDSKAIKCIPTNNSEYNGATACRIGNVMYVLAHHNNPNFASVMYKHDLDKVDGKLEVVANLTTSLVSDIYDKFTKVALTPLNDHYIVMVPYNGVRTYDTPACKLNVFVFDTETNQVYNVLKDSEETASETFVVEGNGKVTIINKTSVYEVTIVSGTPNIKTVETEFFKDFDLEANGEIVARQIIQAVRLGKFAIAPIPFKDKIVLYAFDIETGEDSTTDDSFIYSIDYSDRCYNPQVFINGEYVYLSKGSKEQSELVRFDYAEAVGLKVGSDESRKHTLVGTHVSNVEAPFSVSRTGKFTVYGEFNVDSMNFFKMKTTEIKDNSFIPYNTRVTLTGTVKSKFNRFTPLMKTIHSGGHEILLMFGGRESEGSNATLELDIYDTARHIWSTPTEMPERLKNISVIDNIILGGTKQNTSLGIDEEFPTKLEIVCDDYDTLKFSIKATERPKANYPTYGSYAEDGDILYVVPMDKDRNIVNENTLKVEPDGVDVIYPIQSSTIYNGNVKVIGTMVVKGLLTLILFNEVTKELSFWKNYNNSWSKVTLITEPNGINIVDAHVSFDLTKDRYRIFGSEGVYDAKAIISYVNPTSGIENIYISVKDDGGIEVTGPVDYAYIPSTAVNTVDSLEISKDGFAYYSNSNVSNGEIKRIFPNNDAIGVGVRRLEAHDVSGKIPYARCELDNWIYSVYTDGSFSKINLDTNEFVDLGTILHQLTDVVYAKIVKDELYLISSDYMCAIVKLSDLTNVTVISLNGFGYDISDGEITPNVLTDGNKVIISIKTETAGGNVLIHYGTRTEDGIDLDHKQITIDSVGNVSAAIIDANLDIAVCHNGIIEIYSGTVENRRKVMCVPGNLTIFKAQDRTVYLNTTENKYVKVYEVEIDKDLNFVNAGYTYYLRQDLSDDIIVRTDSDIINFDKGYRIIHPSNMDFNHYCYDNIDIEHDINTEFEDKVVSIGVNNDDASSFVIYTSEKETHLVQTRKVIIDENGNDAHVVPIGHEATMLVDKIGGELHAILVSKGNIYNINASTGNMVTLAVPELIANKKVNAIKNISTKNTYVLHNDTSFVIYNTVSNTCTVYNFDFDGKVETIVKIDPYFDNVRAIYSKDGELYYGVFSGTKLNLKNSTKLDIDSSFRLITSIGNDEYILSKESGDDAVKVKLTNSCGELKIIKNIDAYYKDINTVTDKPLLSFATDSKSSEYIGYNEIVIDGEHFEFDADIVGAFKYREFEVVILDNHKVILFNTISKETKDVIISEEDSDILIESALYPLNTDRYYDRTLDVTKFVQIICVKDDSYGRFHFEVAGEVDKLDTEEEITLVYTDLGTRDGIAENIPVVKSKSNTLTFISEEQCVTLMVGSDYGVPGFVTSEGIPTDSETIVFSVADMVYVYNKASNECWVMMFGTNGVRKVVAGNDYRHFVDLPKETIAALATFESGVYYADNTRESKSLDGNITMYFDPIDSTNEFNSRYIGINHKGNVYDAIAPLSKYEIGSVAFTPLASVDSKVRSRSNLRATMNIIYKSNNQNVVASITAASRINTSGFTKEFTSTDKYSVGEVYAFTQNKLNGSLLRDDTGFYRGDYVVSIVNSNVVNILVDGTVYSYSVGDNTLPFEYEILPIVMAYGSRKNKSGATEDRYFAFMDVRGNVSTYDRELNTFIDVEGNVSVDIPYFSSEVMIYPGKVEDGVKKGVEVWAYSKRSPYFDSSEKITNYAKENEDLLK